MFALHMLAVWDAGSVPAFVAKMDRQALAWGATHTHYADAQRAEPPDDEHRHRPGAGRRAGPARARPGGRDGREVGRAARGRRGDQLQLPARLGRCHRHQDGVDPCGRGSLLFAAGTRVGARPVTVVGAVLGQAVGIAPLSALKVALDASRALVRAVTGSLRAQQVVVPGAAVSTGVTRWGPSTTARVSNAVTVLGFPGAVVQVTSLGCAVRVPASIGEPCGGATVTWGDPLSGRSSATVGATLDHGIPRPSWTQRLLKGD